MDWKYITVPDAQNYLDISWDDDLLSELIVLAEGMIDKYLDGYDFNATTISSERHDFNGSWPYYFDYTPTAITYAGSTSVSWTEGTNYVQDGRRVMFATTIDMWLYDNDDFGFIEFTYTKSNVIPENVRMAMYQLVGSMYTKRKVTWVTQFTQGDLSVSYGDWGFWAKESDMANVKNLLWPFKRVNIQS